MHPRDPVVLLVEDNLVLRSTLHQYLQRRLPVTVIEAAAVSEAVVLTKRYCPAVTLLDLSLPDAPGVTAIAELQSIGQSGRLIVMVNHLERQYCEEATRAGAWACVPKEMLGSQLETLVWKALPAERLRVGARVKRWKTVAWTGRLGTVRSVVAGAWLWLAPEIEWLNENGPWANRPRTRWLYLANVVELVLVFVLRQHQVGV